MRWRKDDAWRDDDEDAYLWVGDNDDDDDDEDSGNDGNNINAAAAAAATAHHNNASNNKPLTSPVNPSSKPATSIPQEPSSSRHCTC